MGTGEGTTLCPRIYMYIYVYTFISLQVAVLCVSYLLKTCNLKHLLCCTEYFVCEEEVYNTTVTQADNMITFWLANSQLFG